jgi:hypothetical protein
MFKFIRITLLLFMLLAVAFYSKNQKLKSRNWTQPLEVIIYPMNGDNNDETVNDYISGLDAGVFSEVDLFFQQQGQIYNLISSEPIKTRLGQVLKVHPPTEPALGSDVLTIVWWGLKFRYWAFKNTPNAGDNTQKVLVFLYYHKADKNRMLQHSLGLDKGLLTIVHAFASKKQAAQNNIIIAHEVLHTVGATDKYDARGQPVFPNGYAEPDKSPLYPQTKAEIMSAHIALSESTSEMAENLTQCVVGQQTAQEINWLKPNKP